MRHQQILSVGLHLVCFYVLLEWGHYHIKLDITVCNKFIYTHLLRVDMQ